MLQRRTIQNNKNNSKNTRINLTQSMSEVDIRKDELMHLARYQCACQHIIDLSKKLKRPLKVLDIGCGESYTLKMLYKSFIVKKSDVVDTYVGVDIDDVCLDMSKAHSSHLLDLFNSQLICQDLTVNPKLEFDTDYFDLVIWFEMIEHVQPNFVPIIYKELTRVVNPQGIMLISTPNADGSSAVLPQDHIYEWSYNEMWDLIHSEQKLQLYSHSGTCVNISKIPKSERVKFKSHIEQAYSSFGRNTAFSSVAIAPLIQPKYCKNILWTLNNL